MDSMFLSFLIDGLINAAFATNPHAENFERGYRQLEVGCDADDEDAVKQAIDELLKVNDDDLLYLQVAANYFLAIGYAKLNKFAVSYRYIDKVSSVDYDFFTRKKDTIDTFRTNSAELRKVVEEAEREYLAYLERLRLEEERKRQSSNSSSGNFWKVVAIIGLCLMVALIVLLIIFLVR